MNFSQVTLLEQSIFPIGIGLIDTKLKKTNFSFDGGIKLGYQYYFDKEALGVQKAFGINTSVYIGAGNPLKETIFSQVLHSNVYYGSESEYVPIKTRIEVSFLWDFWQKGKHTLGLSAGIGYGFAYYLSTKTSNNVLYDNQPHPDGESTKYSDVIINSFYPQIGLYYYYGNHQFSLNYRFSLEYSSNTQKVEFMSGVSDIGHISTQISQNDHLSFGYSYRF